MIGLIAFVMFFLAGPHGTLGTGIGGQLALGTPSLSSGQIVIPVTAGPATNAYSGFNVHLTFDASKLSFASIASGGVLETSGGTTACVGVATDAGAGATGSCNINGSTQQTTSGGTLANMKLTRLTTVGCTTLHLITFGAPDNGTSNTGSYTINSADSTPQSNTYGATNLFLDLATGGVGCVDSDNDSIPDSSDNCPNWPNTSQALPLWPIPAGDSDCDGFPDSVPIAPPNALAAETGMGTDPTSHCAADNTRNNEGTRDRWPVDFDDNQQADGSDLLTFAPVFGRVGPNPPYDARFDLNNDVRINGSDLLKFAPFFGKHCA